MLVNTAATVNWHCTVNHQC